MICRLPSAQTDCNSFCVVFKRKPHGSDSRGQKVKELHLSLPGQVLRTFSDRTVKPCEDQLTWRKFWSGGSCCLQSGQMWSADCSEEALCFLRYVSPPAADSVNGSSSDAGQLLYPNVFWLSQLCPSSCSAPCSRKPAPVYTEIEILNSWLGTHK